MALRIVRDDITKINTETVTGTADSLRQAKDKGIKSVALMLPEGYPKEEGMRRTLDEISDLIPEGDMDITIVVSDDRAAGAKTYPDLDEYIDRHYVREKHMEDRGSSFLGAVGMAMSMASPMHAAKFAKEEKSCLEPEDEEDAFGEALSERLEHAEDPFGVYLLYLIRSKGMTNAQVYNRALISKQSFAKLNKSPDKYHPDKITALQYCVGAELNMDETKDLLARAGYALSPADKRDIIFSYFITHEVFDMIEIDIQMEEHGLPCIIK